VPQSKRATEKAAQAKPTSPRYPIDSVGNAARLLALFKDRSELRITDVASELDISPSTAHRLLTTLEAADMVWQNSTTRCYEPGPTLLSVAAALLPAQSRWDFARPYMTELSERVGETVNLQILRGADVVFVESVESMTPVRVSSRRGAVMPAHCTSGGKILLARLSEADLRAVFRTNQLPVLTNKSVATRDALVSDLTRVRRRGYGTNFGESEPGISGVAVLVPTVDGGEPYALAVSAPGSRLGRDRVHELVEQLRATASALNATSANRPN
jgi:IclR family transcriptional regulator, acetate operon repressor